MPGLTFLCTPENMTSTDSTGPTEDWAFPSLQQQVFNKLSKQRFLHTSCVLLTNRTKSHLPFQWKIKRVAGVTMILITLLNLDSRFVACFLP